MPLCLCPRGPSYVLAIRHDLIRLIPGLDRRHRTDEDHVVPARRTAAFVHSVLSGLVAFELQATGLYP